MIIIYIIIIVVVVNPVKTVEKAEKSLFDHIPAVEKMWKTFQFINRIPVNIPYSER
jgi:hypothetical protein